jgi:hypothetical protein
VIAGLIYVTMYGGHLVAFLSSVGSLGRQEPGAGTIGFQSNNSPAQLTYDFRIGTRSSRQQNNVPASVLSNNGSTGLLSGTDGHEIPLVCVDRLLTQILL